jgi:hypothetical protein
MKVRIIRQTAWDTDGTRLSRFNVGDTYDIPDSLAIYAVAEGWATAIGAVESHAAVEEENRALRESLRAAQAERKNPRGR